MSNLPRKVTSVTVAQVSIVSMVGILATFVFQIVTARLLSPSDYGLVAAFLAIVNIAAIGAGALQNAVAVQVAKRDAVDPSEGNSLRRRSFLCNKFDATTVEAGGLGMIGALALAVFSVPLAAALHTSVIVVLLAAITVPLSFFTSRDFGILQGSHRPVATVGWTTMAAGIRLILVSVFLIALPSAGAAIFGVFLAVVVTIVGLRLTVRTEPYKSIHAPFNRSTLIVISSMILFAWLTNIDLVYVRALLPPSDAGTYAVAAGVVKATLIVPGTISLFLLPRLAKSSKSSKPFGREMGLSLVLAGSTIAALSVIFLLWGSKLLSLIFGSSYQFDNAFLGGLAIAFTPWIICQTLLIRLNAHATTVGVYAFLAAAAVQLVVFLSSSNLAAMVVGNGIVGMALIGALILVLVVEAKRARVSGLQVLK
jgi:O-antigen/teichoic acid export membrane protein